MEDKKIKKYINKVCGNTCSEKYKDENIYYSNYNYENKILIKLRGEF